jgi:tetratricopeptide (TPR) repeat protein
MPMKIRVRFAKIDAKHIGVAMRKILIIGFSAIGIIACTLFFVIGFINVFRGYSVRLPINSVWIAIVGANFLIAADWIDKKSSIRISLATSLIIIISLIFILQSRHLERGKHLYNVGQYQAALTEFQKESNLWYLRLRDNSHNEANAQIKIARAYGRLGQGDKVIPIYELVAQRYPGYNADFAKGQIKLLSEYQRWLYCSEPSDHNNFSTIAAAYQIFNYPSKAIQVYQKYLEADVDEADKLLARKQLAELQDSNSLFNRQ